MARSMLLAAAVCVAGCTSTYNSTTVQPATAKLQRGKSIAIATPANGSYDGQIYASSGESTAAAVHTAFSHYGSAKIIPSCDVIACLRETANAADYLVVPEILHWEDRATEWSGIKDKIEVKLSVYQGNADDLLASATLNGKSKWATFGGDHPQDLLPEPIAHYVGSLF